RGGRVGRRCRRTAGPGHERAHTRVRQRRRDRAGHRVDTVARQVWADVRERRRVPGHAFQETQPDERGSCSGRWHGRNDGHPARRSRHVIWNGLPAIARAPAARRARRELETGWMYSSVGRENQPGSIDALSFGRPRRGRRILGSAQRPGGQSPRPGSAVFLRPARMTEDLDLRSLARSLPERIEADAEHGEAGLARLALTLIELLRKVLEHQAVRRMDGGTLSAEEIERLGLALLRLNDRMQELKATFGLSDDDLEIDLGPLGRLK